MSYTSALVILFNTTLFNPCFKLFLKRLGTGAFYWPLEGKFPILYFN